MLAMVPFAALGVTAGDGAVYRGFSLRSISSAGT
jgi:hypothetical protein